MENYARYQNCKRADRSVRHPSFLSGFRHGAAASALYGIVSRQFLKNRHENCRHATTEFLLFFIFAAFLNLLSVAV